MCLGLDLQAEFPRERDEEKQGFGLGKGLDSRVDRSEPPECGAAFLGGEILLEEPGPDAVEPDCRCDKRHGGLSGKASEGVEERVFEGGQRERVMLRIPKPPVDLDADARDSRPTIRRVPVPAAKVVLARSLAQPQSIVACGGSAGEHGVVHDGRQIVPSAVRSRVDAALGPCNVPGQEVQVGPAQSGVEEGGRTRYTA
jgi:hypothetical protein